MTVIEAACLLHAVSKEDFFGSSRAERVIAARKMAIEGLRAKGLSAGSIARIVKRNPKTVKYWIFPATHQKMLEASKRRYREKLIQRYRKQMGVAA